MANSPVRSPLRRTIAASNPLAYWPVEDGALSSQAASALSDHPPLTVSGSVAFTRVEDYQFGITVTFGTSALANLKSGGRLRAPLPGSATAATAGAWTVHAVADADPFNMSGDMALLEWLTPGSTYVRWQLQVTKADSKVKVIAWDAAGSASLMIELPVLPVGLVNYAVAAFQSGPSIITKVYAGDLSAASTGAAGTLQGVTSITANPTGTTSTVDVPVGHIAVWPTSSVPIRIATTNDTYGNPVGGAWVSWVLEAATDRLKRLCAEEGVRLSMPSLTDTGSVTRMGPQPSATFLDLLRECAEADMGVLHERGFGLGYLPRDARYNRPVSLALDFDAGHIAEPPEPVDDDQQLRNRVTVRRADGSSAPAEDTTSIAKVGTYESAVDLNLADDEQLADHAAWRVHLGTVAEKMTPAELRWLAHHEAAHAVTAVALGVEVDWSDLHWRPGTGGTLVRAVDPHTDSVIFLAGWMGSGGHLWGPRSTHDTQEAIELVGMAGIPAAMRDAEAILASRRSDRAAVAAALLQHGRLTGEQIVALVREPGQPRPGGPPAPTGPAGPRPKDWARSLGPPVTVTSGAFRK